ncbi:OmpH family outer membrane protein [Bacteroides fragilis]|nr:OmpH family outer membrane protein [Bacteroides fragilis]
MLKKIALLMMLILPMGVFAQNLKFGHINAMEIVSAMPEYTKAQSELQALNKQLGQDLQRSREEFSKKYQEFMQQKDSLPAVIAERRQKELEDMMQRQEQFQTKAQQDMEKANNDPMAPVYKKLDDAIKAVGAAEGVIYIFDMARTPIPYVNEAQSINLDSESKNPIGHQIRVKSNKLRATSYKYHAKCVMTCYL